jgi:HEAT repeat protein
MEQALAHPGAAGADTAKMNDELEKAYAEQKKVQQQMDQLNRGLKGGPAGRRQALSSIAALIGPQDALPYLIRGLQDPDWGVREAAASAIGGIACSAKIAVPYLNAVVNAAKMDNIQMTKEEMQQMVRDEDLRRSARDAVAKIQACK